MAERHNSLWYRILNHDALGAVAVVGAFMLLLRWLTKPYPEGTILIGILVGIGTAVIYGLWRTVQIEREKLGGRSTWWLLVRGVTLQVVWVIIGCATLALLFILFNLFCYPSEESPNIWWRY